MWDLKGKVAVITGAASGIGQETAILLAKKGCHVAISDRDMEGLAQTASMAKAAGARVTSAKLDVADKKAFYQYAEKVMEDHGSVQIVVNNAGVALTASIDEMDYEDFEWLFNINFWGMVYGTKAFLPHLKKNKAAHVVNISSVFGICAIPTQGAYNCSKFAIRGFTEALGQELAGSGVTASSVHPGGIKTNIARKPRFKSEAVPLKTQSEAADAFEKVARTTAAQAARTIVNGIQKRKRRVLVGPDAYVFDISQRLFPSLYQRFGAFVFKRLAS